MPRIDELAELLARRKATKAILLSDAPTRLVTEEGDEQGEVFGHRQLTALVEEILPENLFADLVMLEPVEFSHEHEFGEIHLRVVPGPAAWRVVVEPSPEFLTQAAARAKDSREDATGKEPPDFPGPGDSPGPGTAEAETAKLGPSGRAGEADGASEPESGPEEAAESSTAGERHAGLEAAPGRQAADSAVLGQAAEHDTSEAALSETTALEALDALSLSDSDEVPAMVPGAQPGSSGPVEPEAAPSAKPEGPTAKLRRTPDSRETLDMGPGRSGPDPQDAFQTIQELQGEALRTWVREAVRLQAPQILLVPGQRPWALTRGAYGPLPGAQLRLTRSDLDGLTEGLGPVGRARLEETGRARLVALEPETRRIVRLGLFRDQAKGTWAILRIHLLERARLADLELPEDVAARASAGLTLVAGPGLSGRTTTLTALADALVASGKLACLQVGRPPELELQAATPVVRIYAEDLSQASDLLAEQQPALLVADDLSFRDLPPLLELAARGTVVLAALQAARPEAVWEALAAGAEAVSSNPVGLLHRTVRQVLFQILAPKRSLGLALALQRTRPDDRCWQALVEGRSEDADRLFASATEPSLAESLQDLAGRGEIAEQEAFRPYAGR